MLVEHRIHDVHERFVRGEQTVPAREQVAFQPALTGGFTQYFHHLAVWPKVLVSRQPIGHPDPVRYLEDRAEAIRCKLIGSDYAKITRAGVARDDVAQK